MDKQEDAGQDTVLSTRTPVSYSPIQVEGLIPGKVLGFPLFLQVDGRFVPVVGRGDTFDQEKQDHLFSLKQPTVLVADGDLGLYQVYLESNLREITSDDTISEAARARLVFHATEGLMQDILNNPDDPRILKRTQHASGAMVDYILRGRESFTSLLSNCAIDYRTYSHSVHVCVFAVALCQRLGISQDELEEIGAAVLIHDIGKTRIDAEILNKPGPLSEEEWDIMRCHPRWGLELASKCEGLTPGMKSIILHHHEKLDGSGYPDGLKGEEISLVVRAVTICDIFDAVTTNRSYKTALSTYECLQMMEEELRGKIDFGILIELVLLLRGDAPASFRPQNQTALESTS